MGETPESETKYVTGLKLINSLTQTKELFIPNSSSNVVTWYACGPTVYDVAHLGHARNYASGDIVRRVMTNYFGYNIRMCMNVTDIDDKIINRAFEQEIPIEELSRKHEMEFWEDMKLMNCLLPHSITRVSEYMEQIVDYIKEIIKNGFAYEAGGSVYFDIEAFSKAGHTYSKMDPSRTFNPDDKDAISVPSLGKKREEDFVLWKAAKPQEPHWESPWGEGRPGWHIECSAMACNIFGDSLDIHSGGIDLKFPHHTNELAQSEARYNKDKWVNYFIHAGHLHIKGCKMSKSLKNFLTIRECLEKHPTRVWRILFCLNKWSQQMEINTDPDSTGMQESMSIDKKFKNFFTNINVVLRDENSIDILKKSQRWLAVDIALDEAITKSQEKIHEALCDSVDTVATIVELQSLISSINTYLSDNEAVKHQIVRRGGEYVLHILVCLGICTSGQSFQYDSTGEAANNATAKVMDIFTEFRSEIRSNAIKQLKTKDIADTKLLSKEMLTICDAVRDTKLPTAGFKIEDGAQGSVWKEGN